MTSALSILKSRTFWFSAATIACLAGVCIGTWYSVSTLKEQTAQLRAATPKPIINWPVDPQATPTPDGRVDSWLPIETRQEILDLAIESLGTNPLDSAALDRTAKALKETGWIDQVQVISRQHDARVVIQCSWHQPVALVRQLSTYYLISADGTRLPMSWETYPSAGKRLRYIANPSGPVPSTVGSQWIGGDVQAGVELLGYIYRRAPGVYAQIAGIDVSSFSTNRRLVLITDAGNRVVWGRPPADRTPAEPTAETKLSWLNTMRLDAQFGKRIDANRPVVEITNPRGPMFDRAAVGLVSPLAPTIPMPEDSDQPPETPENELGSTPDPGQFVTGSIP